jgi:hypothetical protein
MNRAPIACETIDMAGMGEKPATRSGPCSLIVCTCAAATISCASSQEIRTSPPLPRACWYLRRRCGSAWMSAHAATGSPPKRRLASRYISTRTPRAYGYRTRVGE